MSTRPIRALGEIALRVTDIDAMERFYADTVGLELMRRFPHSAFFRIAEGHAGHTQILALFDRAAATPGLRVDAAVSTVDHLAFTIALEDYEPERKRLESLGISIGTAVHEWVKWRSMYFRDPEGNLVEFVCFDPSVG